MRLLSLTCLIALGGVTHADTPAPVGARAPDFHLPDASTGAEWKTERPAR